MTAGALRVRTLALHADYRCGRSGVCCTSGWEIPVEPEVEARVRAALGSGGLRETAGLSHGARVRLDCDAHGRCRFFETTGGNRCAIHTRLGEDALPSACRQFPRVVRLTPRGVDVTLSHYCPTAASLLFRDLASEGGEPDSLLRIVEDAPAFPHSWPYQGLDARDAVPPLLRPDVLMSWEGLERWEAHAVSVMAEALSAEHAVARLGADAERIRAWTPRDGDFDRFLELELARSRAAAVEVEPSDGRARQVGAGPACDDDRREACLGAWDVVAATVPATVGSRARPQRPAERAAGGWSPAAAGWPRCQVPIRRWLAAKAFAGWLALQGEGLRTSAVGLGVALGVLRAEAARGCAEAGRALDEELLREAVRRADLLLVHLADPDALARRLSRGERQAAC
jgi:Fe-S-cluster containining protein